LNVEKQPVALRASGGSDKRVKYDEGE
jgi:hypothetical protein